MIFRKSGFTVVLALAASCLGVPSLGVPTAQAQTNPVSYWTTAWPTGFGSSFSAGQNLSAFASLSAFDGTAGTNFSSRFDLPNGWFVGSERGATAFNGFGSSWSNISTLSYEGTQVGYNFKNADVPVSIYAGFGTLKYNNNFASPLSGFDSTSSPNSPGYRVNAGVEFRPTSNLSVSFGASFAQQPTGYDGLVLPGASPFRGR
jgi:opacity protein-like surface antigen